MPSLKYSDQAVSDLVRIAEFLAKDDPDQALTIVGHVFDALKILERNPLIGRVGTDPLREFVISHGRTGYLALYWYDPRRDLITVKAIRHQREAGFHET